MCWSSLFALSSKPKRKTSSSGEKKRREYPPADPLHGAGVPVVAEVQEKRRSRDSRDSRDITDAPKKRRSKETVSSRSPRKERERERDESRPQYQYAQYAQYQYHDTHQRDQYRPALNVHVPDRWHRTVDEEDATSSQEYLLNPRPHRSQHHRQRHPKRTSQTTLRGRGAKRDPPRNSKSKKSFRNEPSRQGGWSFFAPSTPPKTPSRRDRDRDHRSYQTLDSSPRSHRSTRSPRSPRSHHSSSHQGQEQTSSRHRSRQHQRQPPSSRQARSRTPNTTARRVPDRRFAVLAATNAALEDVRREAFAQPSPPPRRERLQRYQGVTIPSSTIPFNWDCVSSSQTSAGGGGEPSSRHRRSTRR